ncbi:MAG: O-methyltransferase [Acidimicrobiales bacterium]
MSPKSFFLNDALSDYIIAHGEGPDDVQRRLIGETATLGNVAGMQISPEQGALITLLTKLTGARQAVEIGTFTGYSAICIARGLVTNGRLLCCDVNEEWTSIARRYWAEAGYDDRIELRLGPAAETLRALPGDLAFDLAFIDADKPAYPEYWELVLDRLRPGGVVLVDNVLWGGSVADPGVSDETTEVIRKFNDLVASDDRVDSAILTVGDGMTVARKR